MLTVEWLKELNEEYRRNDVEPKARPWLAFQKYADESTFALSFSSPEADLIFKWFSDNLPSDALKGPAFFVGAYCFDTYFWPVSIPVIYGKCAVEPLKSLTTMPMNILRDLACVKMTLDAYLTHWVDCYDYAHSFHEVVDSTTYSKTCIELIKSGHGELESAIAQICQTKPNSKAMMSSRMAVEMFLKALLVAKVNLDEKGMRRFNHKLDVAIQEGINITNNDDLKSIKAELGIFPTIDDRYFGAEKPVKEIWTSYKIAQQTAATVMRIITCEDRRPLFDFKIS